MILWPRSGCRSYFLDLESWALKAIEGKPSSAPIVTQVIKSIFAVKKQVLKKGPMTGRPAVEYFLNAAKKHFTEGSQPMRRLIRKYGRSTIMDMMR